MPRHSHSFDAIGTRWLIETEHELDPAVIAGVAELCERFDRTWSRFRTDSVVHRMTETPGEYVLPAEAPALFDLYRGLYESTDGAMNPLVGRALEQLGYDRTYTLRAQASIDAVPRWEDAVAWNGSTLSVVRPVVLDVGAAGKGSLVDLVAELLKRADVARFTIDASGDIRHESPTPLRIALENPVDTTRAIGVATITSGALCASASNRRAWPGAHHIVDALTGLPVDDVIATWAIADTALIADGLATALFVGDPARLADRFDFEWVRMMRTGAVQSSDSFSGELFA